MACESNSSATGRNRRPVDWSFSEADGLSGLIVDRYGDYLLLQWNSRALADREAEFVELLQERLQPAGIWRRTERGIGEAEGLETSDGLISGEPPPRPLFIEENQVRFGVDVAEGHKTGFYFDQRDNRLAAARHLRGRVLDLFCYTGGFGLNALRHGTVDRVLAIDSSESALDLALRNAELNEVSHRIDFERVKVADKLDQLRADGERFDGVVLDPPKMARTRGGLERALKGYLKLNLAAVEILNPGGVLVTCSCSGLVSREDFEQILVKVATDSGRRIQILESRAQAGDHPVSVQCLENAYLKCLNLQNRVDCGDELLSGDDMERNRRCANIEPRVCPRFRVAPLDAHSTSGGFARVSLLDRWMFARFWDRQPPGWRPHSSSLSISRHRSGAL